MSDKLKDVIAEIENHEARLKVGRTATAFFEIDKIAQRLRRACQANPESIELDLLRLRAQLLEGIRLTFNASTLGASIAYFDTSLEPGRDPLEPSTPDAALVHGAHWLNRAYVLYGARMLHKASLAAAHAARWFAAAEETQRWIARAELMQALARAAEGLEPQEGALTRIRELAQSGNDTIFRQTVDRMSPHNLKVPVLSVFMYLHYN